MAPPAGQTALTPGRTRGSVITDAQASRYPLLARTREWMSGRPISGPDIRPVAPGSLRTRTGDRPRLLPGALAASWPSGSSGSRPRYDLVVTLVEGRSEAGLVDSIVAQFPNVVIEIAAQPGPRHVAVRARRRARTGRRLRRRAQAAHQGQRAPDRRGRLARPAPRLPVPVAGGDRADPRAAAARPRGRDGRPRRSGAGPGVLGVQRTPGRRPRGSDWDSASTRQRVWFPGGSMFWSRPGR